MLCISPVDADSPFVPYHEAYSQPLLYPTMFTSSVISGLARQRLVTFSQKLAPHGGNVKCCVVQLLQALSVHAFARVLMDSVLVLFRGSEFCRRLLGTNKSNECLNSVWENEKLQISADNFCSSPIASSTMAPSSSAPQTP